MKKKKYESVGLGDLLDGSADPGHDHAPAGRTKRFGIWLSAVTAVAVGAGLLVAPVAVAASVAGQSAADYWDNLPTELPIEQALPQHTILLDKDGKEFARFYSENRIDVGYKDISQHFVTGLVATEDSRFYEHGGVDPKGIARALATNASGGERQGASTITQQLVQNILINNAGSDIEAAVAAGTGYGDKLREARYAVALEDQYSKDEILTMYANAVYLGNGAYGVEAAARIYFDTTAKKLTVPQAALLVGMLKGPAIYDPFVDPEAATDRRNTVISRMLTTGALDAKDAEKAMGAPLGLKRGSIPSGCDNSDYPFYCSLVKDEILSNAAFGATQEERDTTLTRGGMTLTTALDRKAMRESQDAVENALGNGNRAALGTAVVEPGTGHITAIAQNRTWGEKDGQTEIAYAASEFQVGSSMKPIVLATALEQGIPAGTQLNSNGPYYSPTLDEPAAGFTNYGYTNYGSIDAREAIKKSVNVYFIRLIERTGVLAVADMAARLGITSLPRTGDGALTGSEASLALGAYEISPIEMANAYAVFAAHGVKCNPVTIISGVRTGTDQKVDVPDPDCHQAISSAVADTVADTLKQPFTGGGTLAEMGGLKDREAGAKTGTTNDYAANWIVGFTPQSSVAVWLGDPRGGTGYPLTTVHAYGQTHYNLTGSEVAAPVWKETISGISEGLPAVKLPRADDAATGTASFKTVPDVRGLSVSEAATVLQRNGITAEVSGKTAGGKDYAPGIVVEQVPAPGSVMGHKQQASITLSAGSDTTVTFPAAK